VTLKAIAYDIEDELEPSDVLTQSYQITTLCVKSHWDEAEELPPFFVPAITFSKTIYKSAGFSGIKLKKDGTTISGQPIVQNDILYFIPDGKLDDGTYMLIIPENAVKDADEEPNISVQMNFKIGKSKVKQASAGYDYSLFAKTDGSLWAFGDNEYGQLGDGTTTNRTTPVKIMDDVASISAGRRLSRIVKNDRTLWGCGWNGVGQDLITSPEKIANGVTSASAGSLFYLYTMNDGTLWGWGINNDGQLGDGTTTARLSPVKITTGVSSVSAGENHSLIVKNDGTLWACGDNYYGQLGNGTTTDQKTPVRIMTDVAFVSAGGDHSLIVKTDGSLWACGGNSDGQLGDGTTTNQKTPVKIMDDVASVSAGRYHSLIIKNDGSLWACGDNASGQLGDGTTTYSSSPVCIVAATPFDQVTGISLPRTNLQMEKGSQYFLLPTMMPENSTYESIEFESNNLQVATVSSRGIVTGIGSGEATLTVTVISKEGLELTAQCTVTVTEKIPNDVEITLADGTDYTNNQDRQCSVLNYSRTFKNTNWQAWYVPFDLTLTSEVMQHFAFAKFAGTYTEEDGSFYITVVRMKEGDVVKGNTPYCVQAKVADKTNPQVITQTDATLKATEETGFYVLSAEKKITFRGNYARRVVTETDENWYALSGGQYSRQLPGNTIAPFRCFFTD